MPSYKFGLSFYILGEKIMLIEPIINNHIADSGAGYGRLGNLAFLLKEKENVWPQWKKTSYRNQSVTKIVSY